MIHNWDLCLTTETSQLKNINITYYETKRKTGEGRYTVRMKGPDTPFALQSHSRRNAKRDCHLLATRCHDQCTKAKTTNMISYQLQDTHKRVYALCSRAYLAGGLIGNALARFNGIVATWFHWGVMIDQTSRTGACVLHCRKRRSGTISTWLRGTTDGLP